MANCIKCGKPVAKDLRFCPSCGTALKSGSSAPAAQPSARAGGSHGVLSTVDWLVTMIVLAIPLVGLVMIFVWAFGSGNANRRNFCRAGLILMAASIILGLIFGVALRAVFGSYFDFLRGIL